MVVWLTRTSSLTRSASWNPGAGRGGNRIPSDRVTEVGAASMRFAPFGPAYRFGSGIAQAVRGVEVFVERGGPLAAEHVLDGLRASLEHVPRVLLDRVAQLRVLARHDEAYDAYYAKVYGIPGFQAVAAGGGGRISMFGGKPYVEGVLFHELGHNLDVSHGAWRDAVRSDDGTIARLRASGALEPWQFEPVPDPVRKARWTPRLAPGPVTPYGGSSTQEDISESLLQLLGEQRFGHAFAVLRAADGTTRAVTFGEAYPARTALLERSARHDLDGDGNLGS